MDKGVAKVLIRSLVNRLASEHECFRVPEGRLSLDEMQALRVLADLGAGQPAAGSQDQPSPVALGAAAIQSGRFPANWDALRSTPIPEADLRLCIDFGTAMSKAWATGSKATETVPLVLGRVADGSNNLFVPSSIFISSSGRVYLGNAAEVQHRQELGADRKLFDNIKMMLSDAEIGQDLDDVVVSAGINPTPCRLSQGDLLVLYLGWLTDLAVSELEDSVNNGGLPTAKLGAKKRGALRYPKRRFAIPCFATARDEIDGGPRRAEWARNIMKRAIIRAQVVADSLHGRWADLTVYDVRRLMDEIAAKNLGQLEVLFAKADSVREPVAAGSSRFDDFFLGELENLKDAGRARRLMMVVDAGAGTTDFAVFQVFFDPQQDTTRYALVSPSVSMSRLAGNEVDRVLRRLVLEACRVDPKSGHPLSEDEFRIARNDVASRIREIKRTLFLTGTARLDLRPRLSGTLTTATVEADTEYRKLAAELVADQTAILEGLFDDSSLEPYRILNQRLGKPVPIYVVLTGGSSKVPIFGRLADRELAINGARFRLVAVTALPQWISSLPREFSRLVSETYAQEAVAIGGSTPHLPVEISDLRAAISASREGVRVLEKYQVTGVG